MGMEWTPGELECQPARAEIVLASRVAGLEAPVDTVWTRLADDAGLRASTETVRSMGFQGKFCIHPAQIPFVHEVFTPSTDEIAHAREVVAAFDEAEQQGSASIQVGGIFVDYPVVARARKVLAIAKAADPDDAV
jgi:citrate lyase subunit beta/citryl-CoA lyase